MFSHCSELIVNANMKWLRHSFSLCFVFTRWFHLATNKSFDLLNQQIKGKNIQSSPLCEFSFFFSDEMLIQLQFCHLTFISTKKFGLLSISKISTRFPSFFCNDKMPKCLKKTFFKSKTPPPSFGNVLLNSERILRANKQSWGILHKI